MTTKPARPPRIPPAYAVIAFLGSAAFLVFLIAAIQLEGIMMMIAIGSVVYTILLVPGWVVARTVWVWKTRRWLRQMNRSETRLNQLLEQRSRGVITWREVHEAVSTQRSRSIGEEE